MSVSLDLRRAHAAHAYGDITMILTWVNDERAMVLLSHKRKGGAWFIVLESAAFKYDNPEYLARQARKAAEVIGLDESTSVWFQLARIIHDGLPDLIRMPSAPPKEYSKAAYGHMELRADGKTIAQEDYRPELEGVTYG